MDKPLTQQEILNANKACLLNEEKICIVMGDQALTYSKGQTDWRKAALPPKDACPLTPQEALQIYLEWSGDPAADNRRLDAAITFAVNRHAGQFRKGTARPYIFHPLETMLILQTMQADTNLLMAGVLHDTLEDTSATVQELETLFGSDVAQLVAGRSEDKSLPWADRKRQANQALTHADKRQQMLAMADAVANLRSMYADYTRLGEALWARFHAPAKSQAWYYNGTLDALYSMQDDPDCRPIYWEMTGLFKDLFVSYWLDEERQILYQICLDLEAYELHRGDPQWQVCDPQIRLPGAIRLDRKAAEGMEDAWNAGY